MLPVLLDLRFVKIYTFGVFLVLGFFWSCFLLWKNVRLTSHKEEDVFDGLFLSLLGGIFFGRLVYVLLNLSKFGFSVLKFILINGYPGFSIWGGLLGFLLIFYFFTSTKKINFFELTDYFVTPFFVSATFVELGNFFSGSEVGTKTNFPLRTRYFGYDGLRHLTPFYEAIFFALAAFLTYRILLEIRKEKFFKGFLFYAALWYFSLIYFLFDKIKADHLYFLGYSFNWVLSSIILLTISGYFIYYFKSVILNLTKSYGQKISKKIHFRAKRKTTERKGKEPSSD
ncbi:prolipoprotein diacylglyceryl transferase [Patescibacteria group bacterium]|nr:prolipoprotein diacylglyceryl transferase [Patescibacteria group bacterium]